MAGIDHGGHHPRHCRGGFEALNANAETLALDADAVAWAARSATCSNPVR